MTTPRDEDVEQSQSAQLLRSLGGRVWELGTKRSRRDHYMGTRQTPGLPDVIAFLPVHVGNGYDSTTGEPLLLGWRLLIVEHKRAASPGRRAGRLRKRPGNLLDQVKFRECCLGADIDHIVGGYREVVAWLIEHGYATADSFPEHWRPRLHSTPT